MKTLYSNMTILRHKTVTVIHLYYDHWHSHWGAWGGNSVLEELHGVVHSSIYLLMIIDISSDDHLLEWCTKISTSFYSRRQIAKLFDFFSHKKWNLLDINQRIGNLTWLNMYYEIDFWFINCLVKVNFDHALIGVCNNSW